VRVVGLDVLEDTEKCPSMAEAFMDHLVDEDLIFDGKERE
jgi:hypothetical protein